MASVIPMQCSTSWWAGSWSLCKFVIYSYAIPYHPQCTYSDFHVFTIKNTSYCHVQADDWVNFPSNVDVTPHTEEIQEPHKQRTYVTWCYYSLIPSAFTKLLFFFFKVGTKQRCSNLTMMTMKSSLFFWMNLDMCTAFQSYQALFQGRFVWRNCFDSLLYVACVPQTIW